MKQTNCGDCWRKINDCGERIVGYRCKGEVTTHDIVQELEIQYIKKNISIKKLQSQILGITAKFYRNTVHETRCLDCYLHLYCCKGDCGAILDCDIIEALRHEIKTRRIAMGKLRAQKISLQGRQCSYDRIEQNLGAGFPYPITTHPGIKKNQLFWSSFGRAGSHIVKWQDNPQKMSTFCCENCQEAVKVPTDMLGDELLFKCPSCLQENHYDLS